MKIEALPGRSSTFREWPSRVSVMVAAPWVRRISPPSHATMGWMGTIVVPPA
jgi:hypothetical protein